MQDKKGWLADNPSSIMDGEQARLIFIEYQAMLWVKEIKLLIKTRDERRDLVLKNQDLRF